MKTSDDSWMDGVIEFFGSLGWLANVLTIGTVALSIALFVYKKRGSSKLASVVNLDSIAECKNINTIARVVIVDDSLRDFPTRALKSAGIDIETRNQVALSDIDSITTADIVFLDMKGIVRDDPDEGGLKLISELRNRNPVQKICAVSGHTFDPTATAFFIKADDYKKKPLRAQECLEVIDQFVNDLFNPDKNLEHTELIFKDIYRKSRRALIGSAKSFIHSALPEDEFKRLVESELQDPESSMRFVNLIRLSKHANN